MPAWITFWWVSVWVLGDFEMRLVAPLTTSFRFWDRRHHYTYTYVSQTRPLPAPTTTTSNYNLP